MDAPQTEQQANGWISRAKGLAEVVSTPQGMIAVAILLGVGWSSGYLPFAPFDRMSTDARSHNATMLLAIEDGKARDAATAKVVERLTTILERLELRAQLIDCARLTDPDLRARCLK